MVWAPDGDGWLDRLTGWLRDAIAAAFAALADMLGDLVVFLVEGFLDLIATAIEALPAPDFLANYSICSLLNNAGSDVAWAVSTFKIGEGLTVLAGAFAFRMLRKLLTAFQW